jgi:hypothetical protein
MSVLIRAALELRPGCRLRYDHPAPEDLFSKDPIRNGRLATFAGYGHKLVGPLDFKGRAIGRYIDLDKIDVRFDGEEQVRESLSLCHFVVIDDDPSHVRPAKDADECQCVGHLPHDLLFYPDDIVRFRAKPVARLSDEPRTVGEVFLTEPFTTGGIPRYNVAETDAEFEKRKEGLRKEKRPFLLSNPDRGSWSVLGESLELVLHGNVWALYRDPGALAFDSEEEELLFWARDGIARLVPGSGEPGSESPGCSLEHAWKLFTSGEADVIVPEKAFALPDGAARYGVRRLHERWSSYRKWARDLTWKRYEARASQSAA